MPVSQVVSSYEGHFDILLSAVSASTIMTYTLDASTVTYTSLPGGRSRRVLAEGTVLSYNPANNKVFAHATQAAVLGVLLQVADATDGDVDVGVIWRGDVDLTRVVDNATLGAAEATTLTAFGDRIRLHPSGRL